MNELCYVGIVSLKIYPMGFEEDLELIFSPRMEWTALLSSLELFLKVFDEWLIALLWIFFEFHVYFELKVSDLLLIDVEFVVGHWVIPLELTLLPLVFLVHIFFSADEGNFFCSLGDCFISIILLERVDFLNIEVNVFLQLSPHLLLFLLVLFFSEGQYLFNGLFLFIQDQPPNVSLPQVFQRLQRYILERIFLLEGHKPSLLNHQLVPNQLVFLQVADPFFNSKLSDQLENMNRFLLTDSVGSVHSLDVILGIPVDVIDDDPVRSDQVDTQSSGFRGQHEQLIFVSIVKVIHELLPFLEFSAAIKSAVSD